jgi:hypothetical protein
MNKHKNLVFMLLLASAFIGILIWNNMDTENLGGGEPKPMSTEQLNRRLDSLGQNPWDEKAYKALKTDIGASEMAKEISTMEMDDFLAVLEEKAAKAMILSFDNWLSEDCGNVNKINGLVAKMKEQDAMVNSSALRDRIIVHRNFRAFLGCHGSVNGIITREYNQSEVNRLLARIDAAFNQNGVNSCGEMSNRRNEWIEEITKFKGIPGAFELLVDPEYGRVRTQTCDEFRRYTFYFNELVKADKCSN